VFFQKSPSGVHSLLGDLYNARQVFGFFHKSYSGLEGSPGNTRELGLFFSG